jgi:hypothetical protein
MVDVILSPAEEVRIALLRDEIEEDRAALIVARASLRAKQTELNALLARKKTPRNA